MKPRDYPIELPEPRQFVAIRKMLPVSAIASVERCPVPMMVGAPKEPDILAPSVLAILGTVIHHVKGLWRTRGVDMPFSGRDAVDAIELLYERALTEAHDILVSDPTIAPLVPLSKAIEYSEYEARLDAMRRWACEGVDRRDVEKGVDPLDLRLFFKPKDTCLENTLETGIEPWLVAKELRLVGRPDLLVKHDDGSYEIVDDKTGHALFRGKVKEHYAMQLMLYALMVETWEGEEKSIDLKIVGEHSHSVDWDQKSREKARELAKTVGSRFPDGKKHPVDKIARPGISCHRCRLRVRCEQYRKAAERWWGGHEEAPDYIPYDTWGVVRRANPRVGLTDLELEDPAGRTIKVKRVRQEHGLPPNIVGKRVRFFGLEPAQDTILHSRRLLPTSWFEASNTRNKRDALMTRVFIEA